MLYRRMPKNGDELSILGFGCMRLPSNENGTIDEQRAKKQLRYAIDQGVNYVDTAWPYHLKESEPFLGRALANGYREKVKVATKLPSWLVESKEDMDRYLNAQLEKLNTNHIDYYLMHGLVGYLWDKVKKHRVADFLDKAKADRRIVNAGFSFHGTREDFRRIVDEYGWDFCQIQYNFLDEKNQAGTEGLKYASSKGLGVIVMEPLRGGNLAKLVPPIITEMWDQAKEKRTPSEWALRWVWNHPEVTVVLSGMNEEAHIEENLAIADKGYPNSLTEAELQLVKKVAQKYRELMKMDCTGCGYCMPCPVGVEIPICFESYNNFIVFGNTGEKQLRYAVRLSGVLSGGKTGLASQCIQCGECMEKCPQNLKIPDLLKAVVEELEGSDWEQTKVKAKNIFQENLTLG
jgi:uncharacterized protein